MGRLNYEDWVPEEDRNTFSRIEQTIGELENNPVCREASSTLFWQVFFGLKELSAVIEIESQVQAMERTGYSFDEALNALLAEENTDKGAVLGALIRRNKDWQLLPTLSSLPWIALDPAILDRIFNVLRGLNRESVINVKENSQDKLLSVAFTQLHLATALLKAISKVSWGSPEVAEDLISLGERAFGYIREHDELYGGMLISERQALQLLEQAGFIVQHYATDSTITEPPPKSPLQDLQEQREQSLCAVMSLFLKEHFKALRKRGRNEEALPSFAKAVALWARSTSSLEGELSLQAAADCCEDIFLNKSAVRDWEGVANACCLILDELSEFPDSNDLFILQDILGKQHWWPAVSYWQRASTRAENEMSPSQFKQLHDLEKQSTHISRLRNDFLEDLTGVLEPESLKALIQAEMTWHESQPMGGRIEATANELRHAFEWELSVLIFGQAREPINHILQNQELRNRLKIQSKDTSGLSLREMAILLTEAGNTHSLAGLPIRQLIERFPINRKDKDFLYVDLPGYLHKLSNVRGPGEHPRRSDAIQLRSRIRVVRRKALGIGEESYLVRLLAIKKAARHG